MSGAGIITIDIGTTSMRAILFDTSGINKSTSQMPNQPLYYPDGRVEQDADSWAGILTRVLADCAQAALSFGIGVEALSLTSQRSSVIPLAKDGRPLHPAIMWQDTRTQALSVSMREASPEVFRRSGLQISPVFSAIKMRWFRERMPELYSRTWKMAGIQDYVLGLLTGNFVTDRCLASRTNLFNLHSLEWDPALIELFGIDARMLCDLVDQGSVCGHLLPSLASATGLPAGLPVVSAGGDQQCAALGLGLLSADRIVANTGTGSYIIGHSDRPVFDRERRIFCNVSAMPGAYILEAGTLTSGTVYKWFADNFYGFPDEAQGGEGAESSVRGASGREARVGGRDSAGGSQVVASPFAAVNSDAESAPPGANGLILVPHFKGSGAPHWNPDSRGLFYNLTLSSTRKDMARAVLEGIVAEMAENIDLLESLAGAIGMVRVSGGLTRLGLFNQIQADMYGRLVIRPAETEATALGAWISAAVCSGLYSSYAEAYTAAEASAEAAAAPAGQKETEYEPSPENAPVYARLRKQKSRLYAALDEGGIFGMD